MKDTHKALTIALASRILIVIVIVISSFLFTYATTEHMNVNEMNTPVVGLFMRWDSEYYLSIAKSGYPLGYPNVKTFPDVTSLGTPTPSTIAYAQWAFFPLYSAVMAALAMVFTPFLSLTPSLMLSGVIISNISFFVSAYFFYKLTQKLFNSRVALISTAFYSFWVGGVFFSAIYSEALFMALALGAFYYLEENKLPIAVFLGFLASLTRSDGFLIFIPFLIYGLQQMRITQTTSFPFLKPQANNTQYLKLLVSSAIVASAYLFWNVVGYFLAGGVFPVQVIAHNSNWGIDPPLIHQFTAPWCTIPRFQLFYITALIIMLIPIGYFLVRIKEIVTVEAKELKYWGFYASMVYVVFSLSFVYSIMRFAVTMLPIFWVSAKIYTKNRLAGVILFATVTVMLIIGAYLFETASPYFM
jgi:Gpi18-like mannosyltransferase